MGSRPWGKNCFAGNPGGGAGHLGWAPAARRWPSNICATFLAYLDAPTLGQPETFLRFEEKMFDADGGIGIEKTRKFLQGFVDKYVAWVEAHRG